MTPEEERQKAHEIFSQIEWDDEPRPSCLEYAGLGMLLIGLWLLILAVLGWAARALL
jgi:hypothetical protein